MPTVTNTSASLQGKQLAVISDLVSISVKQNPFNAKGDGITDDTVAIRCAIQALPAQGGILFFPSGTYIIHADIPSGVILPLHLKGIRLLGEGAASIIKVRNNTNKYMAIFGQVTRGITDLTGLEIDHLTFDHNIANNIVTGALDDYQATLLIENYGDNIRFHDCQVKNSSSLTNVLIQGSNIKGVWIQDNSFVANGDNPQHLQHESRIIYSHATRVIISGNIMASVGQDKPTAHIAIESHGSDTIITDNAIVNYLCGIVVGGYFEVDSKHIVVDGNSVVGGCEGIRLVSQTFGSHTTGYGLDGVVISDNFIDLSGIQFWPTLNAAKYTLGIALFPTIGEGHHLDIKNLSIEGNAIHHPLETTDVGGDIRSMGIGGAFDFNNLLYNSTIRHNKVENFPFAAINLTGCRTASVDIVNNHIVNCGSTLWAEILNNDFNRFPLVFTPRETYHTNICTNSFGDSLQEVTKRPQWFMALVQTNNDVGASFNIIDNYFARTGTAMAGQIFLTDDRGTMQPYLSGPIPNFTPPASTASRKYAKGSQVVDTATGLVWTINKIDQITWTSV